MFPCIAQALAERGACIRVFDPVIRELPGHVAAIATLAQSAVEAARDAHALAATLGADGRLRYVTVGIP